MKFSIVAMLLYALGSWVIRKQIRTFVFIWILIYIVDIKKKKLFFTASKFYQIFTSTTCLFSSDKKAASITCITLRISACFTICSALPSIAKQKLR